MFIQTNTVIPKVIQIKQLYIKDKNKWVNFDSNHWNKIWGLLWMDKWIHFCWLQEQTQRRILSEVKRTKECLLKTCRNLGHKVEDITEKCNSSKFQLKQHLFICVSLTKTRSKFMSNLCRNLENSKCAAYYSLYASVHVFTSLFIGTVVHKVESRSTGVLGSTLEGPE